MEKNLVIQNRLLDMQKVYQSITSFIDDLPDVIPEKLKDQIKTSILGDTTLKEAMESAATQRPPRLCLIASTPEAGHSIVDAVCSCRCADAADEEPSHFLWKIDDYTLIDAMDYAPTDPLAEELFLSYDPDIILLACDGNSKESISEMDALLEIAIKLKKVYYENNLAEIPLLVAIDNVSGTKRLKTVAYAKARQRQHNLINIETIPISSKIDWFKENDTSSILVDDRWNIDKLTKALEDSLIDPNAKAGIQMALHLDEIIKNLAKNIVSIFTGIAGTVALTPIPVADLYVLVTLQAIMVALIAILSGRSATLETAKEFVISLGGVGVAGLGFRTIAQQSSKLLNGIIPGVGSVISTTVAASGTKAMGAAAIKYYLDI